MVEWRWLKFYKEPPFVCIHYRFVVVSFAYLALSQQCEQLILFYGMKINFLKPYLFFFRKVIRRIEWLVYQHAIIRPLLYVVTGTITADLDGNVPIEVRNCLMKQASSRSWHYNFQMKWFFFAMHSSKQLQIILKSFWSEMRLLRNTMINLKRWSLIYFSVQSQRQPM